MKTLINYVCTHPFHLTLIVTGLMIRYLINRRRFNRRGIGGLQHFPSFGVGLLTTLIEWIFKFIGLLMIAYAVTALLIGR